MLWNHLLQAAFGLFACEILTWSRDGIFICIIITLCIQGIDLLRLYQGLRNSPATNSTATTGNFFIALDRNSVYKLVQLLIVKVIWYSGISLAVAAVARSADIADSGRFVMKVVGIILAVIIIYVIYRERKKSGLIRQYQSSADAGDPESQFEMGILHQNGHGVPRDLRRAIEYYRKAAEQGHLGAQSNLGILYASGNGIEKNYDQALQWFTKAAEQGNSFAQNNLCRLYSLGEGGPVDFVKAYMWLELAIEGLDGAQKEKAIMNRDMFLAKHMKATEIKKAKKMVVEWKADHKHEDSGTQ